MHVQFHLITAPLALHFYPPSRFGFECHYFYGCSNSRNAGSSVEYMGSGGSETWVLGQISTFNIAVDLWYICIWVKSAEVMIRKIRVSVDVRTHKKGAAGG